MSHVVPDLVQKILKGQYPLRILGDGKQIRHFTYGGDLASGIVLAMESKRALNEDFNLSTNQSTTILELAMAIWGKIHPDKPLQVIHDEGFEFDVARRIPSTAKAEEVLGFKAKTDLDSTLNIVIEWVRDAVKKGDI
jgi:nucleoside-diphosphate-sugar epimerase